MKLSQAELLQEHSLMEYQEQIVNLLIEAGFEKVKVCSFKKGFVPNLEKLDLEQHRPISLYLEATGKS